MSTLRLLAVHAHADDESITMGGLLARCADRGIDTGVVCCTEGQLATIYDPEMAANEPGVRPRLAEIRRQELRDACAILGVKEVRFLGYGDSGMAGEDSNDAPSAFWSANLHEATGKLVAIIREFRPHVVVTYDANGSYGHPDHIQAHRATLLAVEAAHLATVYPEAGPPWKVTKFYYTAFPRSAMRQAADVFQQAGIPNPFGQDWADGEEPPFLTDDALVSTTIDCTSTYLRKRAALRAHRSQITEDWPLLAIPEELGLEHFATEHFQLIISRVPTTVPETDVFAGIED